MALDLLRALRGADVAPALEREFAAARGAHAAFDRAADAVLGQVDGVTEEAQARRLAREVALVVRHAASARVVYESRAAHEGRWNSTPELWGAMLDAALRDFPTPPDGARQVNIEVPR